MDRRSSTRHARRSRSWQCFRSQQVGRHVGGESVTAEELDSQPINGVQCGGLIVWKLKVLKWCARQIRPERSASWRRRTQDLHCCVVSFEISSNEEPLVLGIDRNVVARVGVESVAEPQRLRPVGRQFPRHRRPVSPIGCFGCVGGRSGPC